MKQMMIWIKSVLIIFLIGFIAVMLLSGADSKKSAEEIETAITAVADMSGMEKSDDRGIRRNLGLNTSDYDGVVYYKSISTMDVQEILIVKLKSNDQAEAVETAVQSRINSQLKSFNGYGAEQCQLLESSVVKTEGNFVLYVVSQNAAAYKKAFLDSL